MPTTTKQVHLKQAEEAARQERQRMENMFIEWAAQYCSDTKHINIASSAQMQQLLFGEWEVRKCSLCFQVLFLSCLRHRTALSTLLICVRCFFRQLAVANPVLLFIQLSLYNSHSPSALYIDFLQDFQLINRERSFKLEKSPEEVALEKQQALLLNPYANHGAGELKALLKERGMNTFMSIVKIHLFYFYVCAR